MDNLNVSKLIEDAGVIAEQVIHIASMTDGEYLAEPFLSAFEDDGPDIWVALGLDECTIQDCPDEAWEFVETLIDRGLLGFLVCMSTPVPHGFTESGYHTNGWGHTTRKWFYSDSLATVYSEAAIWQRKFIEDRRKQAQEDE